MLLDIPLPWDALHLATNRNLTGYSPGAVDFDSPIVDPVGQSLFLLTNYQLGSTGKLTLRKLGHSLTEVHVEDAPSPEDKEAWPEYVKNEKRSVEQISEDFEKLRQKKDSLAERRHEHLFNFVIPAYFNRLLYDLTLWTANKAIPPAYLIAYGGLAEWPDIRNLSKEAREYFEKYKLEIDQAPKHKSKTKKPTAAERKQAAIWREVQIYIKTSKVAPGAKECIAELKKKPAYKDSRITRQQISKILEKGYNGDYDEILKRL